jgi:hypothetical protein
MTEKLTLSPFESEIRSLIATSEPQIEFIQQLSSKITSQASTRNTKYRTAFFHKPAFIAFLIAILMMISTLFYFGPDVVYAAIYRLFGYIPGVGLVDQSAPIRVLKEPVSITRDGITISVNQAFLTAEKTDIRFGVSGVPLSAYPRSETTEGSCMEREYLLFPDSSHAEITSPIPGEVNHVTLVIPCIFTTLPNTVPTDWEIPIEFIPIPEDVTVMPVKELRPTQENNSITPSPSLESDSGTSQPEQSVLSVDKVIETDDSYILIGYILPDQIQNGWVQITGVPVIKDANGNKVDYTIPEDIQIPYGEENQIPWVLKFNATQITFPITIYFSGEVYTLVDSHASAKIEFDAGSNPQYGQEWDLNQDFMLAGYRLRLKTIRAGNDGYSFEFDTRLNAGAILTTPSVQIAGYEAIGGGGGSGGTSLAFEEIPKGKLELIFSDIFILSDKLSWKIQWQPESIRADWPTPTPPAASICVNENNFDKLSNPPFTLEGKVLVTELNPDINLVLSNLDGADKQVIGRNNRRGILSPDGSQIAYPGQDEIEIYNLVTGTTSRIKGTSGYDLHWSPDGSQLALENPTGKFGIFIFSLNGNLQKQISNLGYESIAGWSPDGTILYYAIPGPSGNGYLLKSYCLESGEMSEMFTLEDSSLKAPTPAISPDGKWIAYRSRDFSKIYIISIDGKQQHSILSLSANHFGISGVHWDQSGAWLGVSATEFDTQASLLYLIRPFDCTSYRINIINGELNGLIID